MNTLLIVYNICGLGNGQNIVYYKRAIANLLNTTLHGYKLVVSSCCSHPAVLKELKLSFGDNIEILEINEKYAVNVTFNKTCQIMQRKYGWFDGFVYVASDVDVGNSPSLLVDMRNRLLDNYGMVAVAVDNDNGFDYWLKDIRLPLKNDHLVPLGHTCNLHMQGFSPRHFLAYGCKILPDVFTSYCSESCFSYLSSAIRQKFIVLKDYIVHHETTMDGSCAVYGRGQDMTFPGSQSMAEILEKAKKECPGFGYQTIFNDRLNMKHDPEEYTKEGFPKNTKLYSFLEENLFLDEKVLNYENIKCQFVS